MVIMEPGFPFQAGVIMRAASAWEELTCAVVLGISVRQTTMDTARPACSWTRATTPLSFPAPIHACRTVRPVPTRIPMIRLRNQRGRFTARLRRSPTPSSAHASNVCYEVTPSSGPERGGDSCSFRLLEWVEDRSRPTTRGRFDDESYCYSRVAARSRRAA